MQELIISSTPLAARALGAAPHLAAAQAGSPSHLLMTVSTRTKVAFAFLARQEYWSSP